MSDQYQPSASQPYQSAPDQHDTAAIPLVPAGPYAGEQQYAGGQPYSGGQRQAGGHGYAGDQPYSGAQSGWYVPGQPVGRSNPEADYWAGKYRSQRRWTRILAAAVIVGTLAVVGVGFAALQSGTSNVADSGSSSTLPDGSTPTLPGAPDSTTPEGTTPNGTTPNGTTPDGTSPNGTGSVPLDSLPLPDSLKSLASAFGITDINQLLDLAVSNGMMSEEDAQRLLSGIQAGSALKDMLGDGGSDSGTGDSNGSGGLPQGGTPQGGGAPQGSPLQGGGAPQGNSSQQGGQGSTL